MTREDSNQTRRAMLGSIATAGLLGVAGCSSYASSPSTDSSTTNGTTTQTNTTESTTTSTTSSPTLVDTEVLEDFEDFSEWSVEGGKMEGDQSQVYTGSQSARIERGRNGPVRLTREVDMDLSKENLSLAFRMQSSGNAVVNLVLRAPDEENQLVLGEGVRQESSGNWFRLDAGARTVAGLPELENVKEIEIRIRGGDGDTKFWLDDLRRVPSPEEGYALLFFDDGRESAYTEAFEILSERDMPATASVVTENVGNDGRLGLDQLEELSSSGWNICSHTSTHTNLEDISRLTAEREIVNAKEWLVDNGFETGARWLVYPYGGFSEAVTSFAQKHHDLAFRYMGPRSIGSGRVTDEMTVSRGNASDLEAAKEMVDLGKLYNEVELFTFHDINGSGDGLSVTPGEFEEFVNYLENSSLTVITPENLHTDLRAKVSTEE